MSETGEWANDPCSFHPDRNAHTRGGLCEGCAAVRCSACHEPWDDCDCEMDDGWEYEHGPRWATPTGVFDG